MPVTRDATGWSNAADDRVEMATADPSWRAQFESEAAALRAVLPTVDGLLLEHFGSTAVAGLRAKPVIDILLVHPRPSGWPALAGPLAALGYVHWAENPRKDRMFFVKGMPPLGARRTHHLHVRAPGDFERELLFRDRLRADPALAQEYERLKLKLADRYPTDRDAYTEGKTHFVARVLDVSAPDRR